MSNRNGAFYSAADVLDFPESAAGARCAAAVTRGRCAATFWKVPASPESVIFLVFPGATENAHKRNVSFGSTSFRVHSEEQSRWHECACLSVPCISGNLR